MFKYSIVIPTYNAGEKWIDCLKAIKEQVFQPVEVLIIDSNLKTTIKNTPEFKSYI